MRRVLRWGVVAAVAAGVAACSGSTASLPSVSADQASSDAAAALCARFDACSAFYVQSAFGDVTSCTTALKAVLQNALAAPGTGGTPTKIEACAQAVPGVSCDDALGHNLPASCQAVAGQLANGAPCGDSSQCQSAYCNKAKGQTCGACAAPPTTGATCDVDDDCPVGNVCFKAAGATSGACVVQGAAGAACDATQHPCKSTLICKSGVCSTPDAAGAPCTRAGASDTFGTCDMLGGEFCSFGGKTCTAIDMAPSGQACLFVNGLTGGLTLCSASGTCTTSTGATSGTCTAAAPPGGSCDDTKGPKCQQPAVCQNGVCVTPDAANCH